MINFVVMKIKEYYFSNHAVKQMFQRNISIAEVKKVVENGETITNYPDDKPYASKLVFAFIGLRPLHVVCSNYFNENKIIIITTYEPLLEIWENNFKSRKKK